MIIKQILLASTITNQRDSMENMNTNKVLFPQKGHVRELELEEGKTYKMITLASKPPLFGEFNLSLPMI